MSKPQPTERRGSGDMTHAEFVTQQLYSELRLADQRFLDERDRRYSEVNVEKEKALKIKETADLAALGLAREIESYKEEKNNRLREQIDSERGSFVTRAEMKPVFEYVSQQQGAASGRLDQRTLVLALIGAAIVVANFILPRIAP